MMRLVILFVLFSTISSVAQKKITTINVSDPIAFASVDRAGELYILSKSGQMQKFGTDGKLLAVYKNGPAPDLFEPRDGSRLLAFFRSERRIEYLNPSFAPHNAVLIDSAFVIEPWLAFSSGDYNLWVLDGADNTMKKFNPRSSELEADVKLDDILFSKITNIKLAREYQGFVFLLDEKKGILIFNSMGKWIKTIPVPSLSYFNFIGEDLYYPMQNTLVHINLFSGDKHITDLKKPFKFALVTDERLFLVQENSIDFFEFKP
jgi:hypothetical protein